MERLNHRAPLDYATYIYTCICTYMCICIHTRKCSSIYVVNEDEGNCEVWKLGGNCVASRNYPRDSGRSGQGCARWSVFATSFGNLRSRIAASRERRMGKGWRGKGEVSEGG